MKESIYALKQLTSLCNHNDMHLFVGMQYLHENNYIHRDLKPHNGKLHYVAAVHATQSSHMLVILVTISFPAVLLSSDLIAKVLE